MVYKNFLVRLLFSLLLFHGAQSVAMNYLRPYDTLIRPIMRLDDKHFNVSFFAEHGFNARGYDSCGNLVNILKIWNPEQNSLQMLNGFDPNTQIGQLAINLRGDNANDDGVRGHFNVCGDLDYNSYSGLVRFHFLHNWFLSTYVPFYSMRLKNVVWQDLTQNITSGDQSVKQKLTNNFFANVAELSCLQLGGWERSGLGDVSVILDWVRDFYQPKPLLKNARVNWRLGLSIPTGLKQNEDLTIALPFGNDGAVGLIFGLGLDLTLGSYLKVGGDIQLHQLFGNTRCRRIKVSPDQTDLLFLAKTTLYKDFGLLQRFNFYVQFWNIQGLALKFGYQFVKRGDDIVSIRSQQFSDVIANTAENLQEYTLHHAVVNLSYDGARHVCRDAWVKPYASLFARIPIMGKRVIASPTVGGVIGFDF